MNDQIFFSVFNLSEISFFSQLSIFLHNFTYPLLFLILLSCFFLKRRFFSIIFLFSSGFLAWLLARLLKHIFLEPRPFMSLDVVPLVIEEGFSFPSEHASVFAALAVSMLFINRKLGYVLVILAILMGLSRIILGVHYPVDVLFGFILGSFIALILSKIFRKI